MSLYTFSPNTVAESSKVNTNFAGLADGTEISDASILSRHVGTDLATGWLPLGDVPDTVTNNGNRSYDFVFNSTDLTDTVSAGMRLRLTRTVSAPTQCADLEASSSQAFTATNATGLATGTTWTWKAKIKPESYTTGVIASVDDGTNLLQLVMNSSGQIYIGGGTSAAADLVTSYQSVELGKWQDVTASITIGTPTGEIRINDVVVPSFVTGSASTTMTINGDEEIYIGRNSGGAYFDGKICQVALFNAVISDATLKTYSGQTMSGSETSCEGFWSLNGVLTDSSANANTLVAGGGALATNVDSPFGNYLGGTLDYAIITKTAFSTNTTLTVQVPEGCAIPTSGGVSAVAYSTQASPYGWPGISNIIGFAQTPANFAGTTNSGNGDDVLGLTTTVTPPPNRLIRFIVTAKGVQSSAGAGQTVAVRVLEGTTELASVNMQITTNGYNMNPTVISVPYSPTSGSHTYKVNLLQSAAGTQMLVATPTAPASLSVEVVGGL